MMEISVVMRPNSAAPIVFLVPIYHDFLRQKRVSVSNDGCNIKVIPNIAAHN